MSMMAQLFPIDNNAYPLQSISLNDIISAPTFACETHTTLLNTLRLQLTFIRGAYVGHSLSELQMTYEMHRLAPWYG